MDVMLPRPSLALVVLTQIRLGLVFCASLVVLSLLPTFFAEVARSVPEYAGLRIPLLVVTMAFTALALLAVVFIAFLVHRVRTGAILARTSLTAVDVVIAALLAGFGLVIVSFLVIGPGQAGSPFLALVLVSTCLALAVTACILLVLRSLLSRAILMRAELEEVI